MTIPSAAHHSIHPDSLHYSITYLGNIFSNILMLHLMLLMISALFITMI